MNAGPNPNLKQFSAALAAALAQMKSTNANIAKLDLDAMASHPEAREMLESFHAGLRSCQPILAEMERELGRAAKMMRKALQPKRRRFWA